MAITDKAWLRMLADDDALRAMMQQRDRSKKAFDDLDSVATKANAERKAARDALQQVDGRIEKRIDELADAFKAQQPTP